MRADSRVLPTARYYLESKAKHGNPRKDRAPVLFHTIGVVWIAAGGGAGGCDYGTTGGMFVFGMAGVSPGNYVSMKRACGDT
eukprot:4067289-Pleurochrysis_carterae.AAC.2